MGSLSYYKYEKDNVEYTKWIASFLDGEIPIDITFHSSFTDSCIDYSIDKDYFSDERPYETKCFFIVLDYFEHWRDDFSYFNHSFTLMVSE